MCIRDSSYCIPPPTCSNAGAISDIVTLSIGFNTSYLWYAFGFSIYGSALCSYGTPAGDVYFPHWLPYLSIIVPAGIVWFSLIVPGTRSPFGAHFSQSIFPSASKNLVSLTTNSSVPIALLPLLTKTLYPYNYPSRWPSSEKRIHFSKPTVSSA